jgi:uncharacterized protein DUF7005
LLRIQKPERSELAMNQAGALLESLGASGSVLTELEAYLENPYTGLNSERLPLKGEPQVEFWVRYVEESRRDGVAVSLSRRFPQLLFPINEGLSQLPEYRAATRRGEFDPARPVRGGVGLERPETLELFLDDGPAGRVPVLVARHRPDFVSLVRALTCRNEPEPVPDSMGACLVKGLADWERVGAYRAAWEAGLGRAAPAEEWAAEMASGMAPKKELWQDRLILLSNGPYSAVPAAEVGVEEAEWRERSVAIRLAHESFHYLTLRLSGAMRSHFLDELLADYAGLVAAFGRYEPALALRFLGIDRLPEIRPDGRLVNYRGALSDGALAVLARMLERSSAALAAIAPVGVERGAEARARRLVGLASLGLDGIVQDDFPARLAALES